MKRKYDLAFSLGAACACSQMLRLAKLQYASFPYDWLANGSFLERESLLEARFGDWPRAEDFAVVGVQQNGWPIVEDRRMHFTYLHDFPPEVAVEVQSAAVCEKYARRQKRLMDLIASSRRVLVVYVGLPEHDAVPKAELMAARERLERCFAPARFDILCFDCPTGVPFSARRDVEVAPGIRTISFDYRDYRPSKLRYEAAYGFLARHFMRGYAVRDYRTPEARRLHEEKLREKEMARFNAHRAFELFARKIEYRIWRHFAKILVRKGIECGCTAHLKCAEKKDIICKP